MIALVSQRRSTYSLQVVNVVASFCTNDTAL